jgi:hypothetical protein
MQRTSWIQFMDHQMLKLLSVFESGYFMRDLDPAGGFQQAQKYYTNQNSDFNSVKVGSRLNNSSDASQNDSLSLAPQYKLQQPQMERIITRVAPGMRLDLNASYFKTKIIEASALGVIG